MPSNIPGYLTPTSSAPLPGSLTLTQFIQSVIVGISGYAGTLVRPKWQQTPPKQPDVSVNWIAFGVVVGKPDVNAYVNMDEEGNSTFQRQQDLDVEVWFYGPDAQDNAFKFLDGFQIQQNLEAMRLADMGYRGFQDPVQGADLIHERWVPIWKVTLTLTRQVDRTYPILSFVSAVGSMHTVVNSEDVAQSWETAEPPPEEEP